jgi:Tol biopolymer transport system component/predicted Ser/Thr protein kinase
VIVVSPILSTSAGVYNPDLLTISVGTKLGSCEIVAAIGHGGMGEVYRARDSRLGRDVALKLLPDSLEADPERRARFDREARALAALNHPGIVTIYSADVDHGRPFLVMELVEGRPLADLIPRHGLPLERLLAIAAQIASAVAAAHRGGIVHRDLKPANVMVGHQDRVKVLDFGLAKLRETIDEHAETVLAPRDITGEGRILGTVDYMSPEQADGRPVDARSDIFSFGVMVYEMASGERPFKGDTSLSVLSAILKDSPKPLGEINPATPSDLTRIVRRCLSKDPEDRYQSAIDLRSDLDDLRQSPPGAGGTPAVSATERGWATWWPWLAGAACGGAAVAATALALSAPNEVPAAVPSLTFSRLTLIEGVTREPMISPDGRWVVYVSDISGNPDIYLQSTTGQTPINLTKDSGAADRMPAFSPDGDSIAFRSERDGGGLFVMGRTGESVRRLTKAGFNPAWFPNGQRIAFTSSQAAEVTARGAGISELWVVDIKGGEPQRLMAGDTVQPSVSPNGRRIAYWALPTNEQRTSFTSGVRDIWTVAADGSNPVQTTTSPAADWNPVWSPDGRWLYFLSNRSGSMNLWRVAIDEASGASAGVVQPLTAPTSYVSHFSLSADGRYGAYATRQVTRNVARIRFDSAAGAVQGLVEPLTTGARDFSTFDLSPDGRHLVVSTSHRQQMDLFVANSDGSGLRNLTNDAPRDRGAFWASDGRILFYSDREGPDEIWSINPDGGELRQVTLTDGMRIQPVSSPDGSKLVASDGNWRLFVHDSKDASVPAVELPRFPDAMRAEGGGLAPLGWSPDGRQLTGTNGTGGIAWLYSFDTKTYTKVAENLSGERVEWLPDRRRMIAAREGRLYIFDTATGEARLLLDMPGEVLDGPQLSPDGSSLYFVRSEQSGDVWIARFDPAEGKPR